MSTTRNSAYIISAQLSLLFTGAIINLGMGRFLGPSVYGQFGVVYAIATILNLLITPGIMQAVSKFSAEQKQNAKAISGSMLKSQLFLGIILAIAYYFLATPIAVLLRDNELISLARILTPLVFIYALTAVYGGYLTGTGKFGLQATQLIIYAVSRLIVTFALAYFFSLMGAVAALPIAAFVALIYFAVVSKLKPNKFRIKNIYAFSLPITAFVGFTAVFLSMDLFFVKALLQDNVLAGYYTAAGTVARIPYFVLSALGIVLLPTVAGKLAAKQQIKTFVQDSMRYVLMILLPATVLIFATAKPLIMLLYRSEYAAAGVPLAIISLGMAALTLSYLFAAVINATQPSVPAATAIGMVILSAALNFALIPNYQLVGAAVATTITATISMLILFIVVYIKIGQPFNYASLTKIGAASVLVLVIALQVELQNKFLLPLLYLALGAIYLITLFALREIKKEDFNRLKDLLPNKFTQIFS